MAVLLSGGAGYIGSHIAAELIEHGYDVVIADDFSNSSPDVIAAIEHISGRPVPCYAIDVKDNLALDKLFSEQHIDSVIHCAGFKAVGESVRLPLKYYRNNIDSAITILEAMQKHGCKRFVFSSSATVYGSENPVPYTESMPAGSCSNPYGRTKYFIEEMLKDAANADNTMSVVLLRYFNPIGAHESALIGERPNGIPNNLMPYITQTAAGIRETLNIFGNDYPTIDGTGVRDYIHVVDLAKGHVAALGYASRHTGTAIFNLGTGKGTSVLELVRAFERATGMAIPYKVTGRRPGDLAAYWADTSKAEAELNWHAEKTIEDMCRDSWRFQKRCMDKR